MLERHKLTDAYFAAQQRVSELLYATEGATLGERIKQEGSAQGRIVHVKDNFDTVEISDRALNRFQQTHTQNDDSEMKQTER